MSVVPQHKKITVAQIHDIARENDLDPYLLQAFVIEEGSGIGFSDYTGKILIQFEPHLMLRELVGKKFTPGDWMQNGVGNQTVEYIAFEGAAKTDREAAMKSTSIGMMQVLGLHFRRLGYCTVQAMWEDANKSEANQMRQGVRFIQTDARMLKAFQEKNYHLMATYYNGSGYQALAKKLGTTPYDIRIKNTHEQLVKSAKYNRTTTTVNIRKGPGANFALAGAPLRVNTFVEILEKQMNWTKVRVIGTGLEGFVSAQYII